MVGGELAVDREERSIGIQGLVTLAETNEAARTVLGFPTNPTGYALCLALDIDGGRWTVISTDVRGAAAALALWHDHIIYGADPARRRSRPPVPGGRWTVARRFLDGPHRMTSIPRYTVRR